MARKKTGSIYVAKENFVAEIDGATQAFIAGRTRVREGHPLLNGRENLFEEIDVDYEYEKATDSPGEKRGK